jgi:hypothetical protein
MIMEFVMSVSTYVLINDRPTDEFQLERYLRQGVPLSPFLFLLAPKGLNVMMNATVEAGLFFGYDIGQGVSISITYLQFAEDTFNMCKLVKYQSFEGKYYPSRS